MENKTQLLKRQMRRESADKLKLLTPQLRAQYSEIIDGKAIEILQNTAAKRVFIFKSTLSEPDTQRIIEYCMAEAIAAYVPKIQNEGIMRAVRVFQDTQYCLNSFGIAEPAAEKETSEAFDVIFTPMVAFDGQNRRLGHGKGYYDRFFEQSSGMKIGLAFEIQRFDAVPVEKKDWVLDKIITEKTIY